MEKNIIVHTPTREDWKRVVQTALDRGNSWVDGDLIHLMYWETYERESCIGIGLGVRERIMEYADKNWYEVHHPNIPILTPDEYISGRQHQPFKAGDKVKIKGKSVGDSWEGWKHLYPNSIGYITKIKGDGSGRDRDNCLVVVDEPTTNGGIFFVPQDLELIKQPNGEVVRNWGDEIINLPMGMSIRETNNQPNSEVVMNWDEIRDQVFEEYYTSTPYSNNEPKGKKMNIIKNAFQSKKQKALAHFNITNGDGGLTNDGQREFVDFLWETNKADRDAFIKKIIEAYEERQNK